MCFGLPGYVSFHSDRRQHDSKAFRAWFAFVASLLYAAASHDGIVLKSVQQSMLRTRWHPTCAARLISSLARASSHTLQGQAHVLLRFAQLSCYIISEACVAYLPIKVATLSA